MGKGQVKFCQACNKSFKPARSFQKFCSAKCRRRVEHLRYVEKYPEEKKRRMDNLMAWKKAHPLRSIRVKKRFFNTKGLPTWLIGA